ncbi:MAG: LPS export ABC transporter periplasmic protein LptC [Acidobacteriota bacterium]
MRFSKKIAQGLILLLALGLSAVLAVGVWQGNVRKDNRPAAPQEESSGAEMKLTDMEYTEMQEGKRAWTLNATNAMYYKDRQRSDLSSVRLTFFTDDGKEIRLESREGTLYSDTKNIELRGDVRAVLPQGYELKTDKASYDHKGKSLASETAIQLNGPDVRLKGEKWAYSITDRKVSVEGAVEASVVLFPSDGESNGN